MQNPQTYLRAPFDGKPKDYKWNIMGMRDGKAETRNRPFRGDNISQGTHWPLGSQTLRNLLTLFLDGSIN